MYSNDHVKAEVIHVASEKLKGISKEGGVVSERSLQYVRRLLRAKGKQFHEVENTVLRHLLIQQNRLRTMVERVMRVEQSMC